MTPKEKARELFMDMKYHIPYVHDPTEPSEDEIAKKCALISLDLLIEHLQPEYDLDGFKNYDTIEYFEKVKQEIIKL